MGLARPERSKSSLIYKDHVQTWTNGTELSPRMPNPALLGLHVVATKLKCQQTHF